MAKAECKSTTPIDARTVGELSDAELNEMMQPALDAYLKQIAQSDWFRDVKERQKRARAEAVESKKASKRLGRAIAIQMGLVAPPWVGELMAQLKPSATPTTTLARSVSSKDWIAKEIAQMKAAGQIPAGVVKIKLAENLEQRMKKAAKANSSIRPIKAATIKNMLTDDLLN